MILYGIPILSIILLLIAQFRVKSAFRKYSEMQNSAGLTGAEASLMCRSSRSPAA